MQLLSALNQIKFLLKTFFFIYISHGFSRYSFRTKYAKSVSRDIFTFKISRLIRTNNTLRLFFYLSNKRISRRRIKSTPDICDASLARYNRGSWELMQFRVWSHLDRRRNRIYGNISVRALVGIPPSTALSSPPPPPIMSNNSCRNDNFGSEEARGGRGARFRMRAFRLLHIIHATI